MKNSYFDRWIVVKSYLNEFEHPIYGRGPQYEIKLVMKDGSFLVLYLDYPSDRMFSCFSSWMSHRDKFDGYYSAFHYYNNTAGNYRCHDVYRYLIGLCLRFGHRYEIQGI